MMCPVSGNLPAIDLTLRSNDCRMIIFRSRRSRNNNRNCDNYAIARVFFSDATWKARKRRRKKEGKRGRKREKKRETVSAPLSSSRRCFIRRRRRRNRRRPQRRGRKETRGQGAALLPALFPWLEHSWRSPRTRSSNTARPIIGPRFN